MKLILTRHGETIENKRGILQGHLDGTLSKKGIEQAKRLALRLKDEKIDAIYSSDLARASNTAKEIAKFHNCPVKFVKELRERDQGNITGKKISEVDWGKPRDTEKKESMRKRAKKILDDVHKKYKDKIVLFVGHNEINKALISIILNKPTDYMKEIKDGLNTAISIFEIKEDKEDG